MKYSISARQTNEALSLADEIMVQYKDRNTLLDYESKGLLDKDIVIVIPEEETELDWQFLSMINEKFNLTIRTSDFNIAHMALDNNIKYFWTYEVVNWYDLRALIDIGVSQIFISAPLTFDLAKVKQFCGENVKIRMYCNLAYENYIPRVEGIRGSYVRPEDIPLYEQYVDVMEFYSTNLTSERMLLKIYKEDQTWPGNLSLLIRNLKINIDNRIIPADFAQSRISCGQRCMSGGVCNLCNSIFNYVRTLDHNRLEWDFETHDWKNEEI